MRNENANEPSMQHICGIVIPHEVPMGKSVSLEMEKKVQGDTSIHFVETVKISDRSQSEVISFIELRHIYGFVLLS